MARFAPETAAFRLARRARYLLSRAVGNRLRNSQQTRFVTRNGRRFKHPIFPLCGTLSYGAWTKPYFFENEVETHTVRDVRQVLRAGVIVPAPLD